MMLIILVENVVVLSLLLSAIILSYINGKYTHSSGHLLERVSFMLLYLTIIISFVIVVLNPIILFVKSLA